MKPLFKRSEFLGGRVLLYLFLAVALIILDHAAPFFKTSRSWLTAIVAPLQYAVDAPIKTIHRLTQSVTTQQELLNDNARLRAHQFLLESKMQKLLVLERENAQLKELLQSAPKLAGGKVTVAQSLAVDLDPNLQQIIIDKGLKDGAYEGQPVLDAYGVMGQIIHVGPWVSRVMLIVDSKSAIPVQNYRNGIRSIAVGLGNGKLALINVPDTSDIQLDDMIVTSGLELNFPVGYPVGKVIKRTYNPGDRFATIILEPAAHIDRSQQVLLSWPDKVALIKAVEEELQNHPENNQ